MVKDLPFLRKAIIPPPPYWLFQQPVVAVPLVMPISRRKEDELSVGSAPMAKQQSYQASEYASSPIKTKTITGMCQEL